MKTKGMNPKVIIVKPNEFKFNVGLKNKSKMKMKQIVFAHFYL